MQFPNRRRVNFIGASLTNFGEIQLIMFKKYRKRVDIFVTEQEEEEEEESCILGVGYKLHNMMRVKPFCSSNIVECRKSILNNYHNLFFLRCIDSN